MAKTLLLTLFVLTFTLALSSTNESETCESALGKLAVQLTACQIQSLQLQTRLLHSNTVCIRKLVLLHRRNNSSFVN